MTTRSIRRIVCIALAVVGLAACGAGDDDPAADAAAADAPSTGGAEVTVETFNFQPDPLEVAAGTTITFMNEDKINHSVTAGTREEASDAFEEGVMPDAGTTFELTLEEPGTYEYFCKFHPGEGMTGVIVVE